MKTPYSKRFTSPQDLVFLLKNRGIEIKSDEKAIEYLANIGYSKKTKFSLPL